MPAQFVTSAPAGGPDQSPHSAAGDGRRVWRLDWFDAGVLGVLALASLVFLAVLAIHGGEWTGVEGFIAGDQAQYLSWVRESGRNLLIGNQFDIPAGNPVLLYPPLLASGGLNRLGLPVAAAYLLWKPVGVLVMFFGVRAFVRHLLAGRWERRAALVVALFFGPPAAALGIGILGGESSATLQFIAGETWPVGHLWGYPMTAIAVGLMPVAFLAANRARAAEAPSWARPGRAAWAGAAAALAVSWIHPWQGIILLATVTLACLWDAWSARDAAQLRTDAARLWPLVGLGVAPLGAFAILTASNASWSRVAEVYRTEFDRWPAWLFVLAMAPLALPALLGYRGRASGWADRVLRLWAPVDLALYLAPVGTFPFHAFNGVAVPLGVLAVRGVAPHVRAAAPHRRRTVAILTAAALALLVVPAGADRIRSARTAVAFNVEPYWYSSGERDALDALRKDSRAGGVLASPRLGQLVPAAAGRATWAGTVSWTPDFAARAAAATALMRGQLGPAAARRLVRRTRARFILQACSQTADLRRALGTVLLSQRRYGCATVAVLAPRRR